ncbi:MAG: OmpH family outer membrane protein [Candidatus Neomarinimicrobiota bacterium]
MYKKILFIMLFFSTVFAQQKIGVVFSETIRLNYEEFQNVERELQADLEIVQKEYQLMATQLDSMAKEYEQQSLMLSEDLKKAKEQDIIDMQNSMQSYQLAKLGPNGELTLKQQQLEFLLVEKFKTAVNAVATAKGLDLIIDGTQASLYTMPTIDLTDDVLTELKKQSTE